MKTDCAHKCECFVALYPGRCRSLLLPVFSFCPSGHPYWMISRCCCLRAAVEIPQTDPCKAKPHLWHLSSVTSASTPGAVHRGSSPQLHLAPTALSLLVLHTGHLALSLLALYPCKQNKAAVSGTPQSSQCSAAPSASMSFLQPRGKNLGWTICVNLSSDSPSRNDLSLPTSHTVLYQFLQRHLQLSV